MEKLKKIRILIIVFLIIILVIISTIALIYMNKKNTQSKQIASKTEELSEYVETNLKLDKSEFNDITSCVKVLLNYLNDKNTAYFDSNGNRVVDEKRIKDVLGDLVDSRESNKSKDDIINKLEMYEEQMMFIPINAKKIVDSDSIDSYVTEGIVENLKYGNATARAYIININRKEMSFTIEPTDTEYKELEKLKLDNSNYNIKKTQYNTIFTTRVNVENIVSEYFLRFKRICLSAPQVAYRYLDEQYRDKRFGNVDNFKKYIQDNYDEIETYTMNKYLNSKLGNDLEYVSEDQYGHHITFKEESATQYTVKLDTYTIETDEFKSAYQEGSNEFKAQMNIDKFILMINNMDYIAAYKLLPNTFKDNYFPTRAEFEKYVKEKWFKYSGITFLEHELNDDVHQYKVRLKNLSNNNTEEIYFYVQLKENTDFLISFEV